MSDAGYGMLPAPAAQSPLTSNLLGSSWSPQVPVTAQAGFLSALSQGLGDLLYDATPQHVMLIVTTG